MYKNSFFKKSVIATRLVLPAVLVVAANSAWSAPDILLDNFTSPSPAVSVVETGAVQNFAVSTPGTYAGVANQFRAAYYWPYLPSTAAAASNIATIGNGSASVSAAPGTIGEYGLGYGAYGPDLSKGQINGAFLNLNLNSYNGLRVTFVS